MIKVTLGEAKKTSDKPFPKLMKSDLGQIIIALSVNEKNSQSIVGFLVKSNGYSIGGNGFTENWNASSYTDYNEPITIQNP